MSLGATIAIIVAAVVILGIISLIGRTPPKGIDKEHFKNEWNDVMLLFKEKKTQPMSIVHADKLLDEALKCLGYSGNTMAERLIGAKAKLQHRDEVWNAHKLRNKIVHETMHEPSEKQMKVALQGYYKTFKDLGVL
ncbi:MAG: hypothetical protein U0491_03880 [Candidatus Saccharimonadales bacterium]